MALVLVFSVALLAAVLISELARNSVLSTAVLFIVVGMGARAMGWIDVGSGAPLVEHGADVALVATLFTDGLKLDFEKLRANWSLATRALAIGLPLTIAFTAVLARWILGLDWVRALLVGAALAPTDPVFAAALVGSEHVPARLRRTLSIESGLNDGLVVPIVLVLIGAAGGGRTTTTAALTGVLLGLALGAIVPLPAVWLIRRKPFGAAAPYKPLFALGILLVAASAAKLLRWNELLASFAAGVALGTVSEKARRHYEALGEQVSELLKLAALLAFAAVVEPKHLLGVGWRAYVFAVAVLVVPRPLALGVALWRSNLDRRERLVAGWFGPKGFASVLFALLIVHSSLPDRADLFHYIALAVVGSMVAHSSTDYLVERWFERREPRRHAEAPA